MCNLEIVISAELENDQNEAVKKKNVCIVAHTKLVLCILDW